MRAVATLLDTSALIVLLRRSRPPGLEAVAEAAAAELRARRAVVSAVTVAELAVGARDSWAEEQVANLVDNLPVVATDREVATLAGRMGRAARAAGATLPLADVLIAAAALYLDLPLLTCDSDFARGRDLAERAGAGDAWDGFRLHPGSVVSRSETLRMTPP